MITPIVDSGDFMALEPSTNGVATAGGSHVPARPMEPASAIATVLETPGASRSGPTFSLPALAALDLAREPTAVAVPRPSAVAPDSVNEVTRPTAPAGVPVAARNSAVAAPESKRRGRGRGRGNQQPATVAARKPEEWVLDPGDFTQLPDRAYQELWFELRTWTWKSLAVVPTVSGGSELDVAEKLVVVGVSNSNRRMSLISAEGASVADTDRVIAMIRAAEARGDRVIVCTDSIHDNPAAAPIIRAVNGAVLSVRLGQSEKAAIERTISTIHRNRIIGVITRRSR